MTKTIVAMIAGALYTASLVVPDPQYAPMCLVLSGLLVMIVRDI
jgi:hypothetical protein